MASRRHTLQFRVTEDGYAPACEASRKQHAKLQVGSIVGGEIARSRSAVQNAYYWAILTKVVEVAPGQWRTPEALHEVLKVATGHVEVVKLIDGRLIKIPESTAFSQMNHEGFQNYMTQAFRIIEDEILGGKSVDEMMNEVDAAA